MIKKITLFSCLFTSLFSFGQSTDASPYCAGDFSGGDFLDVEKYISKVELNGMVNESGTTQFALPHYVYYNNIDATSLDVGGNYELIITHDNGISIHGIAAWIDYNQNNIFEESEKIEQTLYPSGTNPLAYNFTVPADATPGNTRMRVRVYEDDEYTFSFADTDNLEVLPCDYNLGTGETQFDWGETEDYDILIVGATDDTIPEKEFLECFDTDYPFQYDTITENTALEYELNLASVTIYNSLENAQMDQAALPNNSEFLVPIGGEQILYLKGEKTDASEEIIVKIILKVSQIPLIPYPGITVCMDDDGDEFTDYPLTLESDYLSQNGTLDYTFHVTFADAEADNNPITFTYYTGTFQTELYLRFEDIATGCFFVLAIPLKTVDCDEDQDGDGISNGDEDVNGNTNLQTDDTDGDNTPDYMDTDDDGDGLLTLEEDYNQNGDPSDDDTNDNNIPDYLEADITLSVENIELFKALKFYPNPTEGSIQVQSEIAKFDVITITDIQGKILKQFRNFESNTFINISSFDKGVYFIKLEAKQTSITKKVILK
ncbi:T9SS type A sorting domain-containing protein [Aureivirga marina]|uniref:T9SS type A sorting domain-containing protein n=1 Tax=Aureivirga marina TaxID=1182451 RepID=UPI0018C8F3AA|nr:T9SS type A sorting domain-containing protein [Aureivirga marina]